MKWNFRQGGKTENPKDSGIKDFSKHIFESVVREATQNALDKRLNLDKPVEIRFEFGTMDKELIPGFGELVERWEACYEKWKDQAQYEILLKDILNQIESFGDNIPYLSISDFNTKGMDFTSNEDIDKTGYGAFSRGNHSYHDSNSAAGSEGQGKAALYAISAIRTMFVHTISEKGSIYEGLTRFASHQYNGTKFNADGYFPHLPITPEYETVPNLEMPFRRLNGERGTTITLIGLWSYPDTQRKMIKSAINNFWMAIYDGDLILKIDDIELNKDSIESMMVNYLPERKESNRTKGDPTEFGRARCYFETWTDCHKDVTECYRENLNVIGECTLKISQHAEFPGKIAFFRQQKMLIVRSPVNLYISNGYCGVFICSSEQGNEILRKMEGKTHTEWDPNLCLSEEDKNIGKRAIEEITRFISRSWELYRTKHLPDSLELKGLSDLQSFGKTKDGKVKKTSSGKIPIARVPIPKSRSEFEKIGVIQNGFKSTKDNDNDWIYTLYLDSNEDKRVLIKMYPLTDSIRVTGDDLIKISSVTEGWIFNQNTLEGELKNGVNIINFGLDDVERVALDFKITRI